MCRYVWEGDYIPDSALRDLGYIAVGLGILVGTGTFFNLAGTISPVAALKQASKRRMGIIITASSLLLYVSIALLLFFFVI